MEGHGGSKIAVVAAVIGNPDIEINIQGAYPECTRVYIEVESFPGHST